MHLSRLHSIKTTPNNQRRLDGKRRTEWFEDTGLHIRI